MAVNEVDAFLDKPMCEGDLLVGDLVASISTPVHRDYDHVTGPLETAHPCRDASGGIFGQVVQQVDAHPVQGRSPHLRDTAGGGTERKDQHATLARHLEHGR
jgi:hypothetical protein